LNINFTDKEYRLLLDAVFMADWVLTSHDTGPDPDNDPFQMLFQKIYSYAREAGCAELVEEESSSNRYCPSREYEEQSEVYEWIEEYNALSFWEELIERITERDVMRETPPAGRDQLTAEEYWQRAEPYEKKYAAEFEKHGIDRLVIDETL
jgi:hypothetical protein